MTIHFGTDGWRAVISDTFTFHNLRLLAQAIADAVAAEDWHAGNGGNAPVNPRLMVVGRRDHGDIEGGREGRAESRGGVERGDGIARHRERGVDDLWHGRH